MMIKKTIHIIVLCGIQASYGGEPSPKKNLSFITLPHEIASTSIAPLSSADREHKQEKEGIIPKWALLATRELMAIGRASLRSINTYVISPNNQYIGILEIDTKTKQEGFGIYEFENLLTPVLAQALRQNLELMGITFSRDNSLVASTVMEKEGYQTTVHNIKNGTVINTFSHSDTLPLFLASNNHLALLNKNKYHLDLVHIATGESHKSIKVFTKKSHLHSALALDASGTKLAIARGKNITIWTNIETEPSKTSLITRIHLRDCPKGTWGTWPLSLRFTLLNGSPFLECEDYSTLLLWDLTLNMPIMSPDYPKEKMTQLKKLFNKAEKIDGHVTGEDGRVAHVFSNCHTAMAIITTKHMQTYKLQ
jgi:hypothetical protein